MIGRQKETTNLVLSRQPGQTIHVDGPATLRVVKLRGQRVTIAVEAAPEVKILRGELLPQQEAA